MPPFRLLGVYLITVSLSACTGTRLIKPGATSEEVRMDKARCEFEGVRSAPLHSGGAIELAFSRVEIERACLIARGFVEVSASGPEISSPDRVSSHNERKLEMELAPTSIVARSQIAAGIQRRKLGMKASELTDELAYAARLNPLRSGVFVLGLERDGTAKQAGVVPGDVLLSFNEQPVFTVSDLRRELGFVRPGSMILGSVWRNGREQSVEFQF